MGTGDLALFVNVADLSFSLSANFATPVESPIRLPQGFNGLIDVYFVEPTGNPASPWTYLDPAGYLSPTLSIAQTNVAAPPFLAESTSFTYFSGAQPYLETQFDLDTQPMATALGVSPSIKAVFEMDWIPAGTRQLMAQCDVIVSKSILVSSNPPPIPAANYYTQAQVNSIISALTAVGTTISITTSGTQSDGFSSGNKLRTTPVNVSAFTGTSNIRVLAENAYAGCFQTYLVSWPSGSTGVTLNIIDDASSVTLAVTPGTSLPSATQIQLYFNGSNWQLLN